jgi:hypothetical protein
MDLTQAEFTSACARKALWDPAFRRAFSLLNPNAAIDRGRFRQSWLNAAASN